MIDFDCPKCGQHLQSPESMAGKPETCPHCSNVAVVPMPVIAWPAQQAVAQMPYPSQPQQVVVTHRLPEGTVANVLGIIGIVLGGIACLTAWIPLIGCMAIPFAFLALVLGLVGFLMRRPRKGTAIAAMILGGVALLLQIFWIAALGSAANEANHRAATMPSRIGR